LFNALEVIASQPVVLAKDQMLAGDDQQGTFKVLIDPIHQFEFQRFALLFARCLPINEHPVSELNCKPIVVNGNFKKVILNPKDFIFYFHLSEQGHCIGFVCFFAVAIAAQQHLFGSLGMRNDLGMIFWGNCLIIYLICDLCAMHGLCSASIDSRPRTHPHSQPPHNAASARPCSRAKHPIYNIFECFH
jgi:hypothetical protein